MIESIHKTCFMVTFIEQVQSIVALIGLICVITSSSMRADAALLLNSLPLNIYAFVRVSTISLQQHFETL